MNTRTISAAVLILVMGCCVLAAGCESLDTSAADASSSTEASLTTSATLPGQLDDELFGIWWSLDPVDDFGFGLRFDSDGRMFYLNEDLEEVVELTYRVEDGYLIHSDEYGDSEASFPYFVAGDILTITDPYVGWEETYERLDSTTQAVQVGDLTWEILGTWAPTDENWPDEHGPMWEFFDDGVCWQSVWAPELEGYNVYAFTYVIDGDVLGVIDDYGIEQAAYRISIVDDVLTMVDFHNPDIFATFYRDY